METFADRLKAAMNEQGLKQVDLVRLAQQKGIKLGKSHVSQYVSGKTIPRTDILHFLADALQVDPDWLNNNNGNASKAHFLPDLMIDQFILGDRKYES